MVLWLLLLYKSRFPDNFFQCQILFLYSNATSSSSYASSLCIHEQYTTKKNNREVRKLYSICKSYSSKFALIKKNFVCCSLFVVHKNITNGKLFLKNTSKIAYHTKEKFSILDKFFTWNFVLFFFSSLFLGNCQFSTANRYE